MVPRSYRHCIPTWGPYHGKGWEMLGTRSADVPRGFAGLPQDLGPKREIQNLKLNPEPKPPKPQVQRPGTNPSYDQEISYGL